MRLFTLAEAEALLPELRQTVAVMRDHKTELERHHRAYALLARHASGEGPDARGAQLRHHDARERLAAELREIIGTITRLGVEVKGLDQGLLDFPSERDGRAVYLCWQYDEPSIGWWHELSTGFRGRQPLP